MTQDRYSEADVPLLLDDKEAIARKEAENTLLQFDQTMIELDDWLKKPDYRLKPSAILKLNRSALAGLSKYAGVFRPAGVKIKGSSHIPANAENVPGHVEDLCDYINNGWDNLSPIHLASYALWRLNWIHPFVDGNGRTARAISYLILCAKLGYRLPGKNTIPEQIAEDKTPYYEALESADASMKTGKPDVIKLEQMLDKQLARQLLVVHEEATQGQEATRAAVAENRGGVTHKADIPTARRSSTGVVAWIEKHPVLIGLIGTVAVAILLLLFGG